MGGKASLLLVIGFSFIFLVASEQFNRMGTQSYDNLFNYYDEVQALNLANTGTNLASTRVLQQNDWDSGYYNLHMDGGIVNVSVMNPFAPNNPNTVLVCIADAVNPNIRYNRRVSIVPDDSLLNVLLAAGATLGACNNQLVDNQMIVISANGRYGNATANVEVIVRERSFAEYSYFSVNETFQATTGSTPTQINFASGDVLTGPVHVNASMYISGDPVFNGRVSYKDNLIKASGANPKFNYGLPTKEDIPLPATALPNLRTRAVNNGLRLHREHPLVTNNNIANASNVVHLEFKDTLLVIKRNLSDPGRIVDLRIVAPNGVIYCDNMVVRVRGRIEGQYTLAAASASGVPVTDSRGRVYIDGSITYKTDPRVDKKSSDLFGIVAEKHVLVAGETSQQVTDTKNLTIMASIYSQREGFGAEYAYYHSSGAIYPYNRSTIRNRTQSGTINLLGGIIQNQRYAVGTTGSSGSGFLKNYVFDVRTRLFSPPGFPTTGNFTILTWFEESRLTRDSDK